MMQLNALFLVLISVTIPMALRASFGPLPFYVAFVATEAFKVIINLNQIKMINFLSRRSKWSTFGQSHQDDQLLIKIIKMISFWSITSRWSKWSNIYWLHQDHKLLINQIKMINFWSKVTHSLYAAFANFSAALQLLFILDFRLVLMSIFNLHLFIIASTIPFIIKFSTAMSAALKTRGWYSAPTYLHLFSSSSSMWESMCWSVSSKK